MTDHQFTVWVATEGLPTSPILCTNGALGGRLLEDLTSCRAITFGQLLPCCHTDGHACIRDAYSDDELAGPIEVLMRIAFSRGYTWPADQGRTEPEHSAFE